MIFCKVNIANLFHNLIFSLHSETWVCHLRPAASEERYINVKTNKEQKCPANHMYSSVKCGCVVKSVTGILCMKYNEGSDVKQYGFILFIDKIV